METIKKIGTRREAAIFLVVAIILFNSGLILADTVNSGSFSGSTAPGFSGTSSSFSGTTIAPSGSGVVSNTGVISGSGGFSGGSYNSFSGGYYSGFSGSSGIYGASSNPQFNNPSFFSGSGFVPPDVYWPKFNKADCIARQDFIMQIAPGGCSPAVVRSDLLEEQNVPVFCQVMGIKINPLIDVSRIRSINFLGQYPPGVSGISYYPARAAVRSQQNLISSPIQDNLGYVVIILSRQNNESSMPEFLAGNLTATLQYDMQNAFGIGNTNFYASEMSEDDWINNYKQYGFWNGKGYIRAESVEPDRATIGIYSDVNSRISSVSLKKGESSQDIYLNGFYCAAGMNIRVDNIDAPIDSALISLNGQQMWVANGDRIADKKCSISNLNAYAGGGKLTINCPTKNGRIDLSLASGKANLTINEISGEYIIGDRIESGNATNLFLGYVGQDYQGNRFAVLVTDPYSSTFNEFNDKGIYSSVESVINSARLLITDKTMQKKINDAIIKNYKSKIGNVFSSKTLEKDISIQIIVQGASDGISLDGVTSAQDRIWDFTNPDQKMAKEYYDWAIKYYEDLITLYPTEKILYGSSEEPYAAMALYEAALLSRAYGMNEKALNYYDRLMRDYSTSSLNQMVIRERDLFLRYGDTNSKAMVSINGDNYLIELLDFKRPTLQDASATLLVNGKEQTFTIGDLTGIQTRNSTESSLQISEIKDDYVTLKFTRGGFDLTNIYNSNTNAKTHRLALNQQADLDGIRVKLVNINLKKQVKLSITPKAFGPMTQSNFSFKIGIEKRAIKLSPEQTKDMMKNLQDSIKQWNDINEKLGKVVQGLKTACFSTAAVLTVKNLFSGWSGESLARKDIMTKTGGWNEFCEKEVSAGKYHNVQKCLLENNGKINNDIDIYKKQIQATNEKIKNLESAIGIKKTDILDMNGQVDAKKLEEQFKKQFDSFCITRTGEVVTVPDRDKTNVIFGRGGACDWQTLTHDQRKQIMTLLNTRDEIAKSDGSSVLKNVIDKELGKVTLDAKNYWEYTGAMKQQELEAREYNLRQRTTSLVGDKITYGDITQITTGDINHNTYGKFDKGQSVIRIMIPFRQSFAGQDFVAAPQVAGKEVLVQLVKQEGGSYIPNSTGKIVLVDGTQVTDSEARSSVFKYMGLSGATRFRESNAKAYQNKMIDRENLMVKYFEQAPYKGLPSEIPFDVDNGWYVELDYVLSGFGKPYDESGRAINFWICNVGPNGLMEYKKSADDICRLYNGNSNADLNFEGMSSADSRALLIKAQQAITEAAKQYATAGKNRGNVVINGHTFKSGISLGGEQGRCSDFMSPSDCNIMFNVCDPVMCPASRCDLGGEYRVDNVVSTGIIGSLMLCLPNIKEGVAVPICLSGVYAGIQGYVSILNSTVQCLNESITTGKNIGICDEIKSIYLCEFFWKQATPLMNVIIPRVMESFFSQGVRGGGEYLTVQSAWNNMRSSIDYFTNNYAVTSMQAFQARSTEEIGGEICKSFTSTVYPSGNFFEKLTEPDSPVQYTAWFSEDVFTTATIPSTSHYKVYYHIYAGTDQGGYYTVYLKDLPVSNYIYSSQMNVVDQGYITRGSQVDKAVDFTAVSGYKQLCVNVNGKDDCGFGKVTSSYFLNSLTDSYAQQQVQSGIKSSSECVAGTPSLISMVQPNLQAGVEQVINPQLYNSGILRICATHNPGKQVLPNGQYDTTNSTFDRYKDVGYCDDPSIRCWLDTQSVKNVIKNTAILNQTLQDANLKSLGAVGLWTEAQSIESASQGQSFVNSYSVSYAITKQQIDNEISSIVRQLIDLSNFGTTNTYRARALYLLANLYKKIAQDILSNNNIAVNNGQANPIAPNLAIPTYSTPNSPSVSSSTSTSSSSSSSTDPASLIEWTDDRLRDNVIIGVTYYSWFGFATNKLSYKFYNGRGWVTSDQDILKLKNYVEGINAISKKMGSGDVIEIEGETFTRGSESMNDFSDKIFQQLQLENS